MQMDVPYIHQTSPFPHLKLVTTDDTTTCVKTSTNPDILLDNVHIV